MSFWLFSSPIILRKSQISEKKARTQITFSHVTLICAFCFQVFWGFSPVQVRVGTSVSIVWLLRYIYNLSYIKNRFSEQFDNRFGNIFIYLHTGKKNHSSLSLLCLSFLFFTSFFLGLHPLTLSLPLDLSQPSLPTLMQIWAWTDGCEQKMFTCTQLRTKRADACRAAAPLPSPWHQNRPDRRRRRRSKQREDEER